MRFSDRKTASLGTTDEREANQICVNWDVDTILSRPENQTADPQSASFRSTVREHGVRYWLKQIKLSHDLPRAQSHVLAK